MTQETTTEAPAPVETPVEAAAAEPTKGKKKKDKVEEVAGPQGIVFYTDGGCMPHTGMMGWGFHGYRYEVTKPKRGTGHPTHGLSAAGYFPKAEKKEEVVPLEYFDAYGACQIRGTNNLAELMAAKNAFSKAMEYDVKELKIKTDSEYIRRGITEWSPHWIRNNWIRRDGTPVPNTEMWKTVLADVSSLKDKNIKLSVEWVRGHNDNFGNEAADKLATVGRINSSSGRDFTEVKKSQPEGYWKSEVTKHPFFFNPTYYFNTLKSSHVPGEYFTGKHDKDDELLGVRDGDGAYSVVQLKEPESMMEMIRNYQTDMSGDFDQVVLVRLMKLYQNRTYEDLVDYGKASLVRSSPLRIDLQALDREPLTRECKPPLLAWRAMESLSLLKAMLNNFRMGLGTDYAVTEITDVLYDTEVVTKKGVSTDQKKLKASFVVGSSKLGIKAKAMTDHGSIEIPLTLVFGQDLADRNALKRLEATNPKVSVIVWSEAPDVFRYVSVVESEDNWLISGAMYSNTYYHEPLKSE